MTINKKTPTSVGVVETKKYFELCDHSRCNQDALNNLYKANDYKQKNPDFRRGFVEATGFEPVTTPDVIGML